MKTVTASDANRRFSSVLRQVSHGEVLTIVSRGKPVATIGPVNAEGANRQTAKKSLISRLRQREQTGNRNWTRNELYDDRQ